MTLEQFALEFPDVVMLSIFAVVIMLNLAVMRTARAEVAKTLADAGRQLSIIRKTEELLSSVEQFFEEGLSEAASTLEEAVSVTDEKEAIGDLVSVEAEAAVERREQDSKEAAVVPASADAELSEVPVLAEGESTLSARLQKTRKGFFSKLKDVFSATSVLNEDQLEEIEALLIGSDLGVRTTQAVLSRLEERIEQNDFPDQAGLIDVVRMEIAAIFDSVEKDEGVLGPIVIPEDHSGPFVVMLVGVNGAGKTTTAAKLAAKWKDEGKSVLLVAADTFRAAAVDQLTHWGEKLGVEVVRGPENCKPATVVFDGMEMALQKEIEVVIIDTAGRLHTKSNLMQELEGVKNIIQKARPMAPHETVLVVDGASGQNAVQQAREFNSSVSLTGVVVTKLDGTPRGGTVIAISKELGIPVRYIGVGEGQNDLRPFDGKAFIEAFFDSSGLTFTEASKDEQGLSENARKRVRKRRHAG